MPFLLAEILTFQGSTHRIGVGSFSYINNWVDIKYYNFCRFKPYKFHEDSYEIARAIVASDGITLDSSDIGENGK